MFQIKNLVAIALAVLGLAFLVMAVVNRIRISKIIKNIGKDKSAQFNLEISKTLTSKITKGSRLVVLFVILWGVLIGTIVTGLYASYIYQDNGLLGTISVAGLIITLVEWGLLEKYFGIKSKACQEYFKKNKDNEFTAISTELLGKLKLTSLFRRFYCLGIISLLVGIIIMVF